MRSMYNKNAYDLAKDETDAAENVVIDKSAIRAVIWEYDQFAEKKNSIYGTSSDGRGGGGGAKNSKAGADGEVLVVDPGQYEGLSADGSPVVLQLELQKSRQIQAKGGKEGKEGGTKGPQTKGGKKPAAGGGKNKSTKKK